MTTDATRADGRDRAMREDTFDAVFFNKSTVDSRRATGRRPRRRRRSFPASIHPSAAVEGEGWGSRARRSVFSFCPSFFPSSVDDDASSMDGMVDDVGLKVFCVSTETTETTMETDPTTRDVFFGETDDARAGGSRERAERGAPMRRRGARRCEETHDGYALET